MALKIESTAATPTASIAIAAKLQFPSPASQVEHRPVAITGKAQGHALSGPDIVTFHLLSIMGKIRSDLGSDPESAVGPFNAPMPGEQGGHRIETAAAGPLAPWPLLQHHHITRQPTQPSAASRTPPVGAVTVSHPFTAIRGDRQEAEGRVPGFGQLHPRSQVDKDLCIMLLKPDAPPPVVVGVRVWEQAIPQFNIGHDDAFVNARKALTTTGWGNVILSGNYLPGVALGNCVELGNEVAAEAKDLISKQTASAYMPGPHISFCNTKNPRRGSASLTEPAPMHQHP
ncbi:MAG: hypothetical protein WDW36_008092 [Sanguina aurantia]